MKAKKQTERLVATIKFEVFEKADGSFASELTVPGGILEFAAIHFLERHLYRVKAGTARAKGVK